MDIPHEIRDEGSTLSHVEILEKGGAQLLRLGYHPGLAEDGIRYPISAAP